MSDAFAGGPNVGGDLDPAFTYITHPDGSVGRRFPDGEEEKGFHRACDDGTGGFRWVSTSITAADLIDQAVDRARQLAPAPTLDVNPAPEAGGIVNLGMWLAIEPVTPSPIRVEAGDLWAVAQLSLASTAWDLGNGDRVTCDGPGVPIPDLDTVEEGPCGYTYRTSSAEDAPYQLGVTATWSVDYQSSAGAGSAGTIDRSLTVPYDVDEVQTIGEHSSSSGG